MALGIETWPLLPTFSSCTLPLYRISGSPESGATPSGGRYSGQMRFHGQVVRENLKAFQRRIDTDAVARRTLEVAAMRAFIAVAMAVTALLTFLQWQSLFPGAPVRRTGSTVAGTCRQTSQLRTWRAFGPSYSS